MSKERYGITDLKQNEKKKKHNNLNYIKGKCSSCQKHVIFITNMEEMACIQDWRVENNGDIEFFDANIMKLYVTGIFSLKKMQ